MQGAEDESPVIHSQLHRTFCASAGTIGGRRWRLKWLHKRKSRRPFRFRLVLIVRNSREWPSYFLRTYECPWCPHKMSDVIWSQMESPPTVAMDRVAQS
jgi:hypothetical protein